jgi:hypothetical protein
VENSAKCHRPILLRKPGIIFPLLDPPLHVQPRPTPYWRIVSRVRARGNLPPTARPNIAFEVAGRVDATVACGVGADHTQETQAGASL